MGYFKYCEKCKKRILPKTGFHGIKPNKFPRRKYVCYDCVNELTELDTTVEQFLLPFFKAEGLKADVI
jgi:DNA-directed RNA polymerase subunit RPC12/RpoP